MALISSVMKEIADHTCLEFWNAISPLNHYIEITNDRNFCDADVGYTAKEKQKLILGKECMSKGILINQILTSIGYPPKLYGANYLSNNKHITLDKGDIDNLNHLYQCPKANK